MKSSIAAPSLRNSGLLATSTCAQRFAASRSASPAFVPTGTVLLIDDDLAGPFAVPAAIASADGPDGGQVGVAVRRLRRADGDEDQLRRRDRRRRGRS